MLSALSVPVHRERSLSEIFFSWHPSLLPLQTIYHPSLLINFAKQLIGTSTSDMLLSGKFKSTDRFGLWGNITIRGTTPLRLASIGESHPCHYKIFCSGLTYSGEISITVTIDRGRKKIIGRRIDDDRGSSFDVDLLITGQTAGCTKLQGTYQTYNPDDRGEIEMNSIS